MRAKSGLAGATLLYGARRAMPDLGLAMQFLLDDLRAQERRVSGLRLTPASLRLRLDGHELAMSLAEGPLPSSAFAGVRRPLPACRRVPVLSGAFSGASVRDPIDPARGRVLHAIRAHRWALGVLLRVRGRACIREGSDPLALLIEECQSMLAPVIEAAPPDLVLWQPGALACTLAEFTALRPEALLAGGGSALALPLPQLAPRRQSGRLLPGPGGNAAGVLPVRVDPLPDRRSRAGRRSAGQLFGGRARAESRPMPRLDRQDLRLARALRAAPELVPDPAPGRGRDPVRVLVLVAAALLPALVVLSL